MCSWDNAAARATVEVGFGFWSSATNAQAAYDAAVETTDQVWLVAIPVAGLGDSASLVVQQVPAPAASDVPAPSAGRIYVRRGPLVIAVGYYGGIAPTTAALEAAAAHVLAELPQSPR